MKPSWNLLYSPGNYHNATSHLDPRAFRERQQRRMLAAELDREARADQWKPLPTLETAAVVRIGGAWHKVQMIPQRALYDGPAQRIHASMGVTLSDID